jgi:hypothetical protein
LCGSNRDIRLTLMKDRKPSLLPIAFTADLFLTRLGKKPSKRTLRRWAVEGRDGHRLRVVRIGGGWWTREEWVREFIDGFCVSTAEPRSRRAARAMEQLTRRLGSKHAGEGRPGRVDTSIHGHPAKPGVSTREL